MNTYSVTAMLTALLLLIMLLLTACTGKQPLTSSGQVSEFSWTGTQSEDTTGTGTSLTTDPSQSVDPSISDGTTGSAEDTTKSPSGTTTKTPGSSTSKTGSNSVRQPDNPIVPGASLVDSQGYRVGARYGVYSIFRQPIYNNSGPQRAKKSDFIPVVGYVDKNNKIIDTLFDTIKFQPSPNFLYNWSSEHNGMKLLKESDWEKYIGSQFSSGYNVDALDQAVAEVKAALNMPDYKVSVILPVFFPVYGQTSFGVVDGKNLNFNNLEDQKAAIKWMVDEQKRRFEAKKYKNLRLAGFWWFKEDIHLWDYEEPRLKFFTDYVRSLGTAKEPCVSLWTTWFNAQGQEKGNAVGFDLITYQPNFYLAKTFSSGGFRQNKLSAFTISAQRARERHGGIDIALGSFDEESMTPLKRYYLQGIKLGYMNAVNTYDLNGGSVILRMSTSRNAYIRGTYDATYKFVKKTLKESDLTINENHW